MATNVVEFEQPTAQSGDDEVVRGPASTVFELVELISKEHAAIGFPTVIPPEIFIGYLRDGRLRVTAPIRVRVNKDDNHYVLEAVDINECGFGENIADAVLDLQHTIAELFFTLESESAQNRLGNDLQQTFEALRHLVRKAG